MGNARGVAQHAAPGVAHVHGAGGVGGDELHHDLLPVPLVALAVSRALPLDVGEHLAVPAGAQVEIQKAGAGNLGPLEVGALQVQMVQDDLGDGPGRHVQGLGPGHGKGGCVVAVADLLGDIHIAPHHRPGGESPGRGGLLIGVLRELGHLVPGRLDEVRHSLDHLFFCN